MVLINILIIIILGLIARFVKLGKQESAEGWNFGFTNRDLILMAVIAAISAVVNTGTGILWNSANAAAGPLAGAALQGAFMWAYILTFFLVRRPGAMLMVGILDTTLEVFLGNPAGVATIGWGISQGLAAEVVLAICNYRFFNWFSLGLAGAAASQFGTVWTAYLFGWDPSPEAVSQYWIAAPINLISGFILSGLLGLALGKMIARTGLVRATRSS
jgi:energy-coupling factor transport system substrate-specific component